MFINGVSVILTGEKDNPLGMSLAWVSQVEKEHIVISAPKESLVTSRVLENGIFSINQLGVGQEDVARLFGGRNVDKSNIEKKVDIGQASKGTPILNQCCFTVVCKVTNSFDINKQTVIIGQLLETIEHSFVQPLIFKKTDFF